MVSAEAQFNKIRKEIEDIRQMQKRHKAEIEKLQRTCKHTETERMPFMLAPGHFGNDIEMCKFCGKNLKFYNDGYSVRNSQKGE